MGLGWMKRKSGWFGKNSVWGHDYNNSSRQIHQQADAQAKAIIQPQIDANSAQQNERAATSVDATGFQDPNYAGNRADLVAGWQGASTQQVNPQLESLLMARAQGQGGPSAAELQMQKGTEAGIRAGRAATLGVSNPALAQRLQAQTAAQSQLQNVQDTGILRAQEQAAATDQASQFAMQQQQMRNQAVQYYLSQRLTLDQAQSRANQDLATLRSNNLMRLLEMENAQRMQGAAISAEQQAANRAAWINATSAGMSVASTMTSGGGSTTSTPAPAPVDTTDYEL